VTVGGCVQRVVADRGDPTVTFSETPHHHAAPVADLSAYLDLFETWRRVRRRQVLATCQLGYLHSPPGSRGVGRPAVPFLQLLVDADRSLNFADPRVGFAGLAHAPDRDRVLTLWADNLVSVQHGADWIYVLDLEDPLTEEWLQLFRPPDGSAPPSFAVVTAAYDGPAPIGEFALAELEAMSYTSLARIEDRRRGT
jgi:hypothetical protein